MSRPTVLVSGATGKTGACVVAELASQGSPVRALVRVRDARAERLARLGAEVVVADLFDEEQMTGAMQGVRHAYWCPPFHPHVIEAAVAFAHAAREARVEAIVVLSQWLASPSRPSLATRQAWLAGRLFGFLAPKIAYTVAHPGFFADNDLRLVGFAARLGVLLSLTGDSVNASPSNEDIARVAAAALASSERHAGKSYRPAGPALLSTADMAAILGRVLGRSVRRGEMPMWLFLKAARMQGVDAFELSGFRRYVEDHKQGAFALGAPTSDVLEATGRPPEDFAAIATRYAERPEARRSLGNGLRAWADVLRTPPMPDYDLDRLDRELRVPMPGAPRFAMGDERWVAAHGKAAPGATAQGAATPLRAEGRAQGCAAAA